MGHLDRPTRARYGVMGYLSALAFVLYLDRVCIGKAATEIKTDLGLSETQMGMVFGAFTLAYGLFEVVTGHWGDRYGSRRVLIRIVLWWSVFTALTGGVWNFSLGITGSDGLRYVFFNSFLLLLLVRFLFGAGEAGALPNAARVISRWFPLSERGRAQAILNTSMLIGGAVAPVAAAYLIAEVGWRATFVLFGSTGVIWAIVFAAWFRDEPSDHPAVNPAELEVIVDGRGPEPAPDEPHPSVPWDLVLGTPSIWLLGTAMACAAFYTYLLYSWYPRYLEAARGVGPKFSGWLAGAVLIAGACGSILGGLLCDRLGSHSGTRRRVLCAMGALGLGLAGIGAAVSIHVDHPTGASALLSMALFGVALQVAAWWGAMADIAGRHVGALFGLCNSMGIVGAFASQVFYGWFVDFMTARGYSGRAAWDPAFYLYAGVLFIGAVCWLFVDPTRSAVEPQPIGSDERGFVD
jgi:MFS family permease